MSKVGTAVEQRRSTTTATIQQYRDDLASVLPAHIRPDQYVRLAVGLFRRDEKLAAIGNANPGSMMAALLDCARLGLEPGDTYHLVPFGREIVGIADYTGLIELIYRAGAVSSVKTEVVYTGDLLPDEHGEPRFRWIPDEMDRPHHKPDWFSDRGEMIGAYAYAVLRDGSVSQVMLRNKAEIEQVRAVSRTAGKADSPWNKWPDRMWKKTVIRELAKFVPTSAEYRRDQTRQVEAEPVPLDRLSDVLPVHPGAPDTGDVIDGEVVPDDQHAPAGTGDAGVHHDRGHENEQGQRVAWHPDCTLCAGDSDGQQHYQAHNADDSACAYCEKERAWDTTNTDHI